ncbi:MAG: hypothetical protein ACE5KE_15710 [Methanosarcinales archaeon]
MTSSFEIERLRRLLEDHEKRLKNLENILYGEKPTVRAIYKFKNPALHHSKLLGEVLSSEYCLTSNGLTFKEILQIFRTNQRPVDSKKIRDLLGVWVKRKKCETTKKGNLIAYFIVPKSVGES